MISITVESERKRIRVQMTGMLTIAEVQAFSREEQAAVHKAGWGSGEFDLLIEAEGNQVQPQEITQALGALMLNSPLKARRIAIVRDGVLTRMQSRRMSKVRSGTEMFETLADAEAWLAQD